MKQLNQVNVKVACSICKQTWNLPTEHFQGSLHRISGLLVAVLPYFTL